MEWYRMYRINKSADLPSIRDRAQKILKENHWKLNLSPSHEWNRSLSGLSQVTSIAAELEAVFQIKTQGRLDKPKRERGSENQKNENKVKRKE